MLNGLGAEAVRADVFITGDEIVFVGPSPLNSTELAAQVGRVIDAGGRILAPGFIDLHSHGDPLKTPAFENFLAMGVTTITLGQDGSSPEVPSLGQWLDAVSQAGIGPNLAMLVGHGTLRNLSGIRDAVEPEADDMERMLTLLDEELDACFGLSTGLEYHPGLYAQPAELQALAQVTGRRDRLIMSHLRNEDNDQMRASLDELLAQGKHSRVHVAHIKSVYGKGTEEADAILMQLHQARDAGVRVSADIYPYNASFAGISLLFPVWSKTTGQFEAALQNRRGELEEFLRKKIAKRNGPAATLLGTPPYTGKTLADLMAETGQPVEQVLIGIGPQGAAGAYFIMDETLQNRLLIDPLVSVASDGRLEGFHPRGHGTFARVIEEFVVKQSLLTLPEAIRKMTSQPASVLGISDRGVIKAGYKADLVLFDPARVKANATYPQPHQLADGFDLVVVNGQIARENGVLDSALHGQVLKP
ncbi:MAG: amidohydrolase family protein [Pseudomonadales bacterium]|nr:amidohydrolase family protein [Pseudomonadales bacterium]